MHTENFPSDNNISRADIKKTRIDMAIRKQKQRVFFWIAGSVVLAAFLIVGGIWLSQKRNVNLPGQLIPDQGREHVGLGHQHVYNSNPPTSGWHHGRPAEWGVYKEELADEVLIHNLEHGGIWISYKPDIPEEVRKKLEGFYEKWGRKIIVVPRSKNDSDIALAAWNRLDKFNAAEYSDERVEKFIKAFRNQGPEFVP